MAAPPSEKGPRSSINPFEAFGGRLRRGAQKRAQKENHQASLDEPSEAKDASEATLERFSRIGETSPDEFSRRLRELPPDEFSARVNQAKPSARRSGKGRASIEAASEVSGIGKTTEQGNPANSL